MTTEPVQIEPGEFRGWQAVFLRNGLVTLAAVPDIGGRIMAYDLGGYPFLFVDPELAGKLFTPEENQGDGSLAAWKNYGGDKTWPAPQGWDRDDQWHGPPDPVLDSGRYSWRAAGAGTLAMQSPPDPRTGVQIERRVTLHPGSTRVTLDLTFTNTAGRPVRWSIWDVLQLRAERREPDGRLSPEQSCAVTAPVNPQSRFPGGFQVMFGAEDNPQWGVDAARGLFVGRYAWEIGKVGLDSPGGWIAFSNKAEGVAFAERFPIFEGQEYPDGGATVECWTVGRGRVGSLNYADRAIYLMETEVLSPVYDFDPGASHAFRIEWGACRCGGPVTAVTLAGCTASPLILADGRLQGSFGVFEPGELRLAWSDAAGRPVQTRPLGPVSPLQAVELDAPAERPEGATGLELRVVADVDGVERPLAACIHLPGA